jgi:hypothetical protein
MILINEPYNEKTHLKNTQSCRPSVLRLKHSEKENFLRTLTKSLAVCNFQNFINHLLQ